jgi:hypothetical protein
MRLAAVNLGKPEDYQLPMTQQDLADALGISLMHANRVVKTLRNDKIAYLALGPRQLAEHGQASRPWRV